MTREEFNELVKKYEDLWRRADAEKKASGKISTKTRAELRRTAAKLNA